VLMIAVDFFRRIHPKPGQKAVPPALACFLSHVHSDHVSGLEAASFRGPL
jgi:phosphoribosyl 1,2-cyclic phosphodiesterase